MTLNEFNIILDVLKKNGHKIMIKKYSCYKIMSKEEREEIKKENGYFYDCYEGQQFIGHLFNLKDQDILSSILFNKYNDIIKYKLDEKLEKNYIYFFKITILNSKNNNYLTNQVHYFEYIYNDNPILIQSYGGIKGITIKNINNIDTILNNLFNLNHKTYKDTFDIPKYLDEILHFDNIEIIYIKKEIIYPTINKLVSLLL